MTAIDFDSELVGLARNWRDSVAHALEHFSELRATDYGFHNRKWIILSVHHAAEVFCNYLLRRSDPSFPPNGHYPSLRKSLILIRSHAVWQTLRQTERDAIVDFFSPLSEDRNSLMHRAAGEKPDISRAAMATLALLVLVRRLSGENTFVFFDQSPPIEMDVVEELRVEHLSGYTAFVERVVAEEYDFTMIEQCGYCGGMTKLAHDSCCQACFHEDRDWLPT